MIELFYNLTINNPICFKKYIISSVLFIIIITIYNRIENIQSRKVEGG